MIFKILSLSLTIFIKLSLLYICLIWIIGFSLYFFGLFTNKTMKVSEIWIAPFKQMNPFKNKNTKKKGK